MELDFGATFRPGIWLPAEVTTEMVIGSEGVMVIETIFLLLGLLTPYVQDVNGRGLGEDPKYKICHQPHLFLEKPPRP